MMFEIWILSAVVFGGLGAWVADNKGVSAVSGLLLGALLGPIGLIIIALLNPASHGSDFSVGSEKFVGTADLSNDGYKLWLVSRFGIQKNEVLDSYACQGKLFSSVDTALEYARGLHKNHIVQEDSNQEYQAELLAQLSVNEDKFRKIVPLLTIVLIGLIILISWYFSTPSY